MVKDYDENGVLNVAEALINRSRQDYISGGKIFFEEKKRMPENLEEIDEFIWPYDAKKKKKKKAKGLTLSKYNRLVWFYDSYRFFAEDPLDIFKGRVKPSEVLKSLNEDTIISYYRDMYIDGAEFCCSKKILDSRNHSDAKLKDVMGDTELYKNYILARKEMKKLGKKDLLFFEWDESARDRFNSKRKKYSSNNRKED